MRGPAAEPLVRVRRLRVGYAVPRGHPDPEATRARLHPLVARAVPGALVAAGRELARRGAGAATWDEGTASGASGAAGGGAGDGGGVWCIRRLDVDLAVHAAWDADAIARAWTPRIARSLVRAVDEGGDGVRYFPRPADHLARFLAEAAAGTAWDRWYLRAFAPLRALPLSTALRLALEAEPAVGRQALAALASGTLEAVTAHLDAGDARQVLDSLACGPDAAPAPALVEAAAAAQAASGRAPSGPVEEPRLALRLAVALADNEAGAPAPGAARAARAVARLARVAASGPAPAAALLHAIRTGDAVRVGALLDGDDPAEAAAVTAGLAGWRPAGAAAPAAPATDASGDDPAVRTTTFGGLFLLLGELAALPLDHACDAWPDCEDHPAATTLRFLVALRCLGRPAVALADPAVRDTMGIGTTLAGPALERWQHGLRRRHLQAMARLAAARPHGIAEPVAVLTGVAAGPSPEAATHDNRAAPRPGRVALVVDVETATWLGARAWRRDRAEAVDRWARAVATGRVTRAGAPDAPVLPEAARLQDDFRALAPVPGLGGPLAVDLLLRVLAQRCLRGVARRLPGHGRAGLVDLRRDVLDVPARVEEHADRFVVVLGRPPLDVLLTMTGLSRATVAAPWRADRRPYVLFPEAAV